MAARALLVVALALLASATHATTCTAHRGASSELPENSIAAFREAELQGAASFELDLRLSSDHVVVVMHDTTVDRTTNCTGVVSKIPYHGYMDSCAISDDEVVPTLDDVLEFLLTTSMKALFDIKAEHVTEPLIEYICEAVAGHPKAGQITMATWTPGEIDRTIIACTESPIAWVASVLPTGNLTEWGVDEWNLNYGALRGDPTFIEEAHALGHFIYAWTVNDANTMLEMAELGVDSIVTDYPARCVETIDSLKKKRIPK